VKRLLWSVRHRTPFVEAVRWDEAPVALEGTAKSGPFSDSLTSPEFREEKIDQAKNEFRSGISQRNDNPHGIAERGDIRARARKSWRIAFRGASTEHAE